MLTVKIISGTYGHNTGKRIEPKDCTCEPFSLTDDEAKRLVSLGVAKIVFNEVATVKNDVISSGQSVNPSDDENGNNGEFEGENDMSGHIDATSLEEMTIKDLKRLAGDMGIDTSKMKRKAEYIEAIANVELPISSDDIPPDISPEAPVV